MFVLLNALAVGHELTEPLHYPGYRSGLRSLVCEKSGRWSAARNGAQSGGDRRRRMLRLLRGLAHAAKRGQLSYSSTLTGGSPAISGAPEQVLYAIRVELLSARSRSLVASDGEQSLEHGPAGILRGQDWRPLHTMTESAHTRALTSASLHPVRTSPQR